MDQTALPSHAREESGQVLVLVAGLLVVLLGFAAVAIDVGYAYYGRRALQVSADAAALAGASQLPDEAKAKEVALEFSGSPGSLNERSNIPNVDTSVSFSCVPAAPKCKRLNLVLVTQHAHLRSFFGRVVGIGGYDIHASAAACTKGASAVHLVSDDGPCPVPVTFKLEQRLTPNDSAVVSTTDGGPTPTGNVRFQLFPPTDATCSGTPALADTAPLSGGRAATANSSFVATDAGSWRWRVFYGGDDVYEPVDGPCGLESFDISN